MKEENSVFIPCTEISGKSLVVRPSSEMTCQSFKCPILVILFFTFFLPCRGQYINSIREGTYDSIRAYSNLIAFKDTIVRNGDTIIVRKEVWIRERDSLLISFDTIQAMQLRFVQPRWIRLTLRDTVLIIEDTLLSRDQRVLHQIKEISSKKTWYANMLRAILVFPDQKAQAVIPLQQSSEAYYPFEGKIIRQINIRVLDVFGMSISQPDRKPTGLIEKGGNFLHLKTHRWIIRNKLLFSEGDTISSLKMSESERLLRENNFIYDARVFVRDSCSTDSVDVEVVVQDIWSISGAAGADPNSFTLSLKDVNFLGLGQQIEGSVKASPLLPRNHNLTGNYIVNNLSRTYLTSNLYYRYQYGETYYGGGINREFISPAIKWAGGTNISWNAPWYYLKNHRDSVFSVHPYRFVQNDVWLGYGLDISRPQSSFKGTRLMFAGRYLRTRFYEKPLLPDSLSGLFYDNDFYLASVGIFGRRYYKDNYIFRLGRTEDIPEGFLLSFLTGIQQRVAGNRPYFSIQGAWARYNKWGYLYSNLSYGGFQNRKRWEEAGVIAQLLYFTPLMKVRHWKYRYFAGVRWTSMYNQAPGSYLNIMQEQGLRGFTSPLVRGSSRIVVNYELNLLPPLKLIGFRAALIFFTDFAWISYSDKVVDKNNFYPCYGLGIRFRNDHLIFSTAQIMIGYYPNGSSLGLQDWRIYERSKVYYNYYNLQYIRPSTLNFY